MKRLITLSLIALTVAAGTGCKPRIRVKPKMKSWTQRRVAVRPVIRPKIEQEQSDERRFRTRLRQRDIPRSRQQWQRR